MSVPIIHAPSVHAFLSALLPPGARIALRGVGEKGTDKFGAFSEPVMCDTTRAMGHLTRWTENGIGAFVVPGTIAPGVTRTAPHDDDVMAFTSILVDLDDEALAEKATHYLSEILGPPSIIVASSGTASPKRHLYWLLDEPCEDTRMIAATRRHLAELVGGDAAFFRIPQIIRVPGTTNHKGGEKRPVALVKCEPETRYTLDDLLAAIADAERPAWAPEPKRIKRPTVNEQGLLVFTPETGTDTRAPLALTQDITEGGGPDANRWSEFSRVAGHYIHALRAGQVATPEEAKALTEGWMLAHMKPAWPADRFEREWAAILSRDINDKGPIAASKPVLSQGISASAWQAAAEEGGEAASGGAGVEGDSGGSVATADASPPPGNFLQMFAARRWTMSEKPVRKWLVQGLVAARKSHLLVAEGGAGKTYAVLDLGMKIAAPRMGDRWLGQMVNREAQGTVVILTAEDDKDEIHIRLADMDPDGSRRAAAGDRFIVVPLMEAGGALRLVQRNPATGASEGTPAFEKTLAWLKEIPDLRLVIFDTLASTLHGDENSSMIAQEWAYAAQRIISECRAAYMALHHVRKMDRQRRASKDAAPRTIEDVRDDIRGSNALTSAVRLAIVIWQPEDWKDRMERLGLPPKRGHLWQMGVAKANNPEAMAGERTLMRTSIGSLEDITETVRATNQRERDGEAEVMAWALWHIEQAAIRFTPFTRHGSNSMFAARGRLHPCLRTLKRDELQNEPKVGLDRSIVGRLLTAPEGGGEAPVMVRGGYMDVPHGPIAMGEKPDTRGLRQTPDWSAWEYDAEKDMIVRRK